jgi:FAD/FMN-containing dehydrogenase
MPQALPDAFSRALNDRFSSGFFSTSEDDKNTYGTDWTRVHRPTPSGVAFPRSTQDVSDLLALCHLHEVPVVPSGGRTGLAGGAVAQNGELVISMERMRRMDPVDVAGATVTVQAGVITEAVHQHTEPLGLTWPVDFASKGSSQVGGNIATNAGGVRVIRYGTTRRWVLGLQVVLADGRILELNQALEKNNTGMDLKQLFIGTEGTLGIITEATLKLTKRPRSVSVFLFAMQGLDQVVSLFRRARASSFELMAFEFFSDACVERLIQHRKARLPFDERASYYALLEVEQTDSATGEPTEAQERWLEALFEDELVSDGVLAQNSGQARELWAVREGISESLSATGHPHKNDVALPIARLEAFSSDLLKLFETNHAGWEVCLFGHIGDGNLHINVMKPDGMAVEDFLQRTHRADLDTFGLVRDHHGSISAEHGIGLLKKDFLHFTRAENEITLLRDLKRTLDPKNILNPGKIFDL